MELKSQLSGFKTFISAIAVMTLGWGTFWAGTQGVKLAVRAFSPSLASSSQLADVSTAAALPATSTNTQINTQKPATSTTTASSDPGITIMIGGDIMMDREVRHIGTQYGYDSLFTSIGALFSSADFAVTNLEGPITSNPSKTLMPDGSDTSELTFTFATSTAPVLARAHITAVSLANNHTDNFGRAGVDETRKWLATAGVKYFGDPDNYPSTETVLEKDGMKIALVGYHSFEPGFATILADVKRLSGAGDFVIVMPHWGVEYSATATALMEQQARQLAAAGAGAIIGSHPHVIEGHEWIQSNDSRNNVPVFYSLGNLIFDQYFSPSVMKGNIIALHFTDTTGTTTIAHIHVYEVSISPNHGPTLDGNEYDVEAPK